MQESKDRRATAQKDESKELSIEHQSDATSKETLHDLEKTDSKPDKPSDETSIPSPDGSANPERPGRADGSDTSGPM